MKRKLIILCAGVLVVGVARGASPPSYSLSIPGAPVIRVTTDAAQNAWLASNSVASVSSLFGPTNGIPISLAGTPGLSRYTQPAAEAGFSVERIKPEVWLGDAITPPGGIEVDWNATYAEYCTNAAEQAQFIFDNIGKVVYTQVGGSLTFNWIAADGTVVPRIYIASGATSGRPFKMFWTESPWNAPVINLSGKFVRLFGPSSLVVPEYGVRETTTGGHLMTETNVVVRGIYFDPSAETLSAYGQVSGQFILAYYDSGSFTELKHIQVIEVGEPDITYMDGHIGEAIKPHGTGYDTKGLWPQPVANNVSTVEDEFGPYYYQHKGSYSYSPKNNDVFPLRETVADPWRIDVYWMESDAYGVNWPFERCQYACTWNTNAMPVLVAGDSVKIPDAYNAELVKYQVPNGHARAPENGFFTANAPDAGNPLVVGYSCLRLNTSDNVWFLPIRTVARGNTDFFTLEDVPWSVGSELVPRGGSVSGTASGYSPVIDTEVPGLLNLSESGTHYNPQLYYDWTTTSNDVPSVIYAVNTSKDGKPLEVHWFTSVQERDMPAKISIPCLVQRYMIAYPEPNEAPQIVIASQRGGAANSVFEAGCALYFDSTNTTARLPAARCFRDNSGGISFWVNAENAKPGTGRVLTLANDLTQFRVLSVVNDAGVKFALQPVRGTYTFSAFYTPTVSVSSGWHRVAFSLRKTASSETVVTVYLDGVAGESRTMAGLGLSGYLTNNVVGKFGAVKAPEGLAIDGLVVGSDAADAELDRASMHTDFDPADPSIAICVTFGDNDLLSEAETSVRHFTERVSGTRCEVTGALCLTPGAPRVGNGVFLADSTPVVYRQPDPDRPGYNPNEEHAFVGSGSGGYFAWALRCDLNKPETSEPGVLVQYSEHGRPKMKYFSVLLTNETYAALAADATAGTVLPGPHPLDTFDNPWCPKTYWDHVEGQVSPAFPDRKNQVWSRCAGTLPIHMYYRSQDGFDYPGVSSPPAVGAEVPWLAGLDGGDPVGGKPACWTWTVRWPENVENMRIGQTLTTAANGLPEVWNCKSMAVIYPDDGGKTALLWDPTVVRHTGLAGFATPAALLKNFGFDPAEGNVTLRGGKYTFKDLPPSVGDRFYVNANLAVDKCVCLKGELATNAGGSILYPNVLNGNEKAAIKGLVPAGHANKTQWDGLVETLPTTPVTPSTLTVTADGAKASVSYAVKDHYALTAMGATNYVTLIENDAPTNAAGGQLGVQDGDAISMHVFRVLPEYYAGRVVTREDPLNLLSQQLSILYTESFAGKADEFEFEWKKSVPNANGSMSTDYTNVYKDVFAAADWAGLTRFTIGQQGDTLANLVNTYYVMRYRAKKDSAPYAVMGDTWSDWCGPALAEGWIQRCVNNVTPFTQRMRDLYENKAETTVSMIAQAGKPWTGDVALNQDNLTEVGLIELYQTLLNKAESMSLTVGLNDNEANKQLLLAAERLCDLYVLLGNEAYDDAMNPTIGFGTEWPTVAAGTTPVDFGAESTGLFCFDNQVPSLLDEELALLRGRTGANNPSVTTAPFYNRLVWNFTRGITAGEVAYAVNYNISSTDNNASVTEDDAALQYPQGHGDAWGHYLSAMSVWYRLLRNPNFSWSTSQMQMNVADSVVDVDYYDEERFAETAGKLAKTAVDIMDRTARKSWRDNGGAKGAGYLDGDTDRNFGYGEWATRGGVGGVMNWMVANSLLPGAEQAGEYHVASLGADSALYITNAPVVAANGPWTFEFQVAMADSARGELVDLLGEFTDDIEYEPPDSENWECSEGCISLAANGDGTYALSAGVYDYYLVSITNVSFRTVTNLVYDAANPLLVAGTNVEANVRVESIDYDLDVRFRATAEATLAVPSNALVAIDSTANSELTLRVLDATGTVLSETPLGRLLMDEPVIWFGGGFTGTVGELRFWNGRRTSAELHAARAYVNPRDPDLLAYTRGISESSSVDELADETPGGDHPWEILSPEWTTIAESGLNIAFDDDGLLRINRATAADLQTIADSVDAIQRKLDQLDCGMNPLGLSDTAVPMDISSEGVAEGTSTHFEQVAERAKTALGNAVKILDRAQTAATQIRHIANGQDTEEEESQRTEAEYNAQLIAVYGMPYEDDIGPAGTYPQGYEGPDLYHYMYMDLSLFGISGAENLDPVSVVTYDASTGWTYESIKSFMQNSATNSATKKYSYQLSANGLVIKPSSITGTRRACGKMQEAYTEYILAWVDWKNAYDAYKGKFDRLSVTIDKIDSLRKKNESAYTAKDVACDAKYATSTAKLILQNMKSSFELGAEIAEASDDFAAKANTMTTVGIGLTAVLCPGLALYSAVGAVDLSAKAFFKGSEVIVDGLKEQAENIQAYFDTVAEQLSNEASWNEAQKSAFDEARDAVGELSEAAREVQATWAKMVAAAEKFDTVVAEGDRIQQERAAARAKRVNHIIDLRYADMFFRQSQDETLTRYSQAFDLAQKYVYMAAQAYDYETGLLSADSKSGDRFRAEIIGSRSLGKFTEDGDPLPGSSSKGDPGLADILYRMQSNYSVLKGRLGLNNPDKNATWFSLRQELFRISSETNANADWSLALSKCVVDDIRTVPEYRRFCQSIASTSPLLAKEPAIVIPFSSSIDFAKNFFGKDLMAGDHALDSSYYATKISAAGVKLERYPSDVLGATPAVYLVPAGIDAMRVPGGGEDGTLLYWNVADQVIPVPYAIGSTELDNPDWQPLFSGDTGGIDPMAKIRRIPSFRAIIGDDDDAEPASTRLIGRSAWNTRWVMIIPAGSLLGGGAEDRGKALSAFINGVDTDRDGIVDVPGVSDIVLGLKTYATSGN